MAASKSIARIKMLRMVAGLGMLSLACLAAVAAPANDEFPQAVARVLPGVAGVGAYVMNASPSVLYFGTGFVVGDGHTLATNAHVVAALRERKLLDQMRVFFAGEEESISGRPARIWSEDPFHDVALVRFDGPPAPALSLDVTAPLQGQAMGILGYPIGMQLGLIPAAHRGVVAAVVPAVLPLPRGVKLTPELAEAIRRPYNLYQLDMLVFPGNSGSPLFDASTGRVYGIINRVLAGRTREHLLTNPSGIAYAVPVRWVEELWLRTVATQPPVMGPDRPATRPAGE